MTTYVSNRRVPLGAVTTFRLVSFVERAVDSFSKWRSARATAAALSGLSNAQLADIGVLRGEIDAVADRLVRR